MSVMSIFAVLSDIGSVITAINVIIEACNKYYDNVNETLEKINEISGGQFTVNLIETGNKLKAYYQELLEGLKKMLAAIQAILDENKGADEQAANSLKSANSKY